MTNGSGKGHGAAKPPKDQPKQAAPPKPVAETKKGR